MEEINNQVYWNNMAYNLDHYFVIDKKSLCKGIMLSGVMVPVLIPVPLCVVVVGVICLFVKQPVIKIKKLWKRYD